jgi:hypothetical protein
MVQMTMQVSEELAERLKPAGMWLPTVLELSLIRFRTVATGAASEVIDFLMQNPGTNEVLNFHLSEMAQNRLQRLLALNTQGLLSEEEEMELDELEQLEHVMVVLKASLSQN